MNHSSANIINEITNSCSLVQQHQQQSSVKLLKLVKVTNEHTESITNPTSIKYIQTSLPTRQFIKTTSTAISPAVPSTNSQNSDRTKPFTVKKPPNSTTITKCQSSPKISSYFIRENSNSGVALIVQSTASNTISSTSANINTVFTKPIRTLPSPCPNIAANAKLSIFEKKRIPLSQPNTSEAVFYKPESSSVQTYSFNQTNSSDSNEQRSTNRWDCLTTTSSNAVTLFSTQTWPSERTSKSTISSASQSIPLETRYRNILENLLQLKNPFVQRTVTLAVQQKICNQTSDDLLNVIFKTLELILTSIDVKQTLVNEPYLTATASFLTKVIDTGRYMELIESRKETKDIHKYITPNMSKVLNRVTLETAYKSAREIFAQKNRSQYAQILELLAKATGCLRVIIDNRMNSKEIVFWMKEIWPLVFDPDIDIQNNAIEAMDKVIPLLLISNHQNNQHWPLIQLEILKNYTTRVSSLFTKGNQKWYLIWCQCVQLLDAEIPRSATVLNSFLSIVEAALRSAIPLRRAEGYICWRVLLEVLVRHDRLNSEKRLKLMCTPLRSLQARTAEIAMNKYLAWWYVICNVHENTANYIGMVFEPFLQFCFGPLSKTPKLTPEFIEAPTQVKNYANVSIIAVTSLISLLGNSDPNIEKRFKENSINMPKHQILTETIFSQYDSAALVINACGEATTMLNTLSHNKDEYDNCIQLLNLLWKALFLHINQAKKIQYIQLIFNNLLQMHNINVSDNENTEVISIACGLIMTELSTSFITDTTKPDIVRKTLLRLFNMIVLDPSLRKLTIGLQSKLLLLLTDSIENFTQFIVDAYDGFFDKSPAEEEGADLTMLGSVKFQIWSELADNIAMFFRKNTDQLKELHDNSIPVFDVFFKFLYWPLMLSLSDTETQFDSYLEKLLKTVDLMLSIVDKRFFYKESAKTLELIIKTPLHCKNINDAIAVLFDDMNYEFTEILDAPFEMLELCSQLLQKNTQIVFQDFDSIVNGLINYRRQLNESHLKIIAPKLHDVMTQLTDVKHNLRTDKSLIDELKKLLPNESGNVEKMSTKSNKKVDKGGFVIVDKVWTLEPTKLTERQREKMKTRACDIPALYNDMSRSQDSYSIQEWAPTRLGSSMSSSQKENLDAEKQPIELEIRKSSPKNNRIESDESSHEKSESKRAKMNIDSTNGANKSMTVNNKKETKKSGSSPPQAKKVDKKKTMNKQSSPILSKNGDAHDDDNDNEIKTKRVTREQSRVENETNRMSRRSITKAVVETTEKRKTRSDKALGMTTNHIDLSTRRATRASLSAPPSTVPRQKNKSETKKRAALSENESPSGQRPLSKRARQTRQSKNDPGLAMDVDSTPKLADVEIKKEVVSDDEATPMNEPANNNKAVTLENDLTEQVTTVNDSNDEAVVPKQEENDDKIEGKKEVTGDKNLVETAEMPSAPFTLAETAIDNEMNIEGVKDKEISTDDKMQTEANAQTETAPILHNSNNNDTHTDDAPKKPASAILKAENETEKEDDQINNADKSYMSTLCFADSPEKINHNDSNIVTSPTMDAQRNLEFLNDTLNISPIISDSQANDTSVSTLTTEVNEQNDVPSVPTIEKSDTTQTSKESSGQKRRKLSTFPMPIRLEDIKVEPEDRTSDTEPEKNSQSNRIPINVIPTTPSQLPTQVQKTSASAIKCSTPVQSHQSPVSSKFLSKTQLSGRGAQLLQMINSHKGARSISSPIPSTSAGPSTSSAGDLLASTSSPTINCIQLIPLNNDESHTPKQDADYLTFSSVLPSPLDSPGVSILKRKNLNDTDDSFRSPVPKRKRVSFNFPLSETKEYMIEDENPMLYPLFNDSPSTQRNGIKNIRGKFRWKRIKHKSNSAKSLAKFASTDPSTSSAVASNESATALDLAIDHLTNSNNDKLETNGTEPEEQVSVSHIREYLEMNTIPPVEDQDLDPMYNPNNTVGPNAHDGSDANHAARPIEAISENANRNDPNVRNELNAAADLSSFSDDEIFKYLTTKFSMNDILERLEPSINIECAHFMVNKMSTMMENSKRTEQLVMEQLAEKHSKSFLEYTIGENSIKNICDRVVENSQQEFIEYFLKKAQDEEPFIQALIKQSQTPEFRKKMLDAMNLNEQRQLVDEIIAKVPRDDGSTEMATYTWVANLLRRFKFTPEQFLSLTHLYLQQNPVQPSF